MSCRHTESVATNKEIKLESPISIAQARKMSGKTVRVTGTVTVQSGAFASAISSGFAIQDDTAGIYVIDDSQDYQLGQTVSVMGVVGAENNQINISMLESSVLPAKTIIEPQAIKTGKLADGERGSLVSASGTITKVEDQGKYGYKLFIDDGSGELQIYISRSSNLIETIELWNVGLVISVLGFAGVYHDTYEILPRQIGDIARVEIK